jgi:hypothetical protein
MTEYGGFGGTWGTPDFDPDDLFEVSVNRVLGDAIRAQDGVACAMWCALANVEWTHEHGDTALYSFRSAGDLVAAIRGEGMYMDWYCCGPSGTVSEEIRIALASEGWTPRMIG